MVEEPHMESLAAAVGTPRGRGVPSWSGGRTVIALVAALAVLAGVGVPGAGALGTAGSDAFSGAPAVVTGTVERLHLDDYSATSPAEHQDDLLTFVRTAGGAVRVPASALDHVPDGATVRLGLASTRGVRLTPGGAVSLTASAGDSRDPESGAEVASVQVVAGRAAGTVDTGTSAAQPSAALEAGLVPHQVTVVVARPSNGTALTTSPTTVANAVSGAVSDYWETVTGGTVSFTTTAYPDVVATTSTPCANNALADPWAFWDEVATKAGWTQGAGKHLLVYFERLASCGTTAGLGTLGNGAASGGMVWTNGHTSTGVLGHELGHNLGLGHSQELDCTLAGTRIMDAPAGSCAARSYWDTHDIMAVSWWNQGFLNASHLRRLGVLEPGAELAPATSGQVTLTPLSTGAGRRVLTLSDGATRYVVEYRAAVGLDDWMATDPGWGAPGVTVRREFDQASVPAGMSFPAHASYLLDGDPRTDDPSFGKLSARLPLGTWMGLAGGRLGLRVVSQNASGAVVAYRAGPGAPSTPIMSATGGVSATVLTTPRASVRVGKVPTSRTSLTVPLRWSWSVVVGSGSTTRRTDRTVPVPVAGSSATTYRASAASIAGTALSPTGSATARHLVEQRSPSVRYAKSWTTARSSTSIGSSVRRTTAARAKVTARVTGRSVGVLLQRGPSAGRAAVYIDGRKVAVLDLRSKKASTQVAWASTLSTSSSHTVRVVNLSTGKRLGFDGLVVVE
jgi:hypothetical protein